jgi:hypothetical protein
VPREAVPSMTKPETINRDTFRDGYQLNETQNTCDEKTEQLYVIMLSQIRIYPFLVRNVIRSPRNTSYITQWGFSIKEEEICWKL